MEKKIKILTPEELEKLEKEQEDGIKPVSLSELAGQIRNKMYQKTKEVVE